MRTLQVPLAYISIFLGLEPLWYKLYGFILNRFLSRFSKDLRKRVYVRNSMREKTLVPPLSDIDITIIIDDKDIQRGEISKINEAVKKSVLIKEVNLINVGNVNDFSVHANRYEFFRDPALRSLGISESIYNENHTEKIAFILKQLRSDAKNLGRFPLLRVRKWENIFKQLNLELIKDENLTEQVAKPIIDHLNINKESFTKLINSGLEFNESNFEYGYLFPVEFLNYCFSNSIDFKILKPISIENQLLFVRLIENEIWGLYTQRLFYEDGRLTELVGHVENLDNLAKHLCEKEVYDKIYKSLHLLLGV